MRVLMVDADERLLEAAQGFLWSHGYETIVARHALDCVLIMSEFPPDVLVLDRELLWGGSDGVLEWIGDRPHFADVPVVLTFHNECDEDPLGMTGLPLEHLRKPYSFAALLASIEAGLESPSSSSRSEYDLGVRMPEGQGPG